MNCYWGEGPDGLSINELCRRIGVSKPAIYRAFGGEDGLLTAVLNHYKATVLAPILEILQSNMPLQERITTLVDTMTVPNPIQQGCLLVKMRLAPHRLGPQCHTALQKILEELHISYLNLMTTAQAQGILRGDVPPELAAHYMNTQLTTTLIQMNAGAPAKTVRAQAKLAMSALFYSPTPQR